MINRRPACAGMVALCVVMKVASASGSHGVTIPIVPAAPQAKRLITIDDIVSRRQIDSLSVSADGRKFAIFVRQGDPSANAFRTGWFVGSTTTGALVSIGGSGEVQPGRGGIFHGKQSYWSPDGSWLAYALTRKGETQLWRSRADGTRQEQVTSNAADVQEFAWRSDGKALYFVTGKPRAELAKADEEKRRAGYSYDEDAYSFSDFISRQTVTDDTRVTWVVTLADRNERAASQVEAADYERMRTQQDGGVETSDGFIADAAVPPVKNDGGGLAWLERLGPSSRRLRVSASISGKADGATSCLVEQCSGVIQRAWWSKDGQSVLFWRKEGINEASNAFYSWKPVGDKVRTIARTLDDELRFCAPAYEGRILCVRETATHAAHVATIDTQTGDLRIVADANPEFANFRFGKAERFEWPTPKFDWNERGGALEGLYDGATYGRILFPPDFDPSKRYPVVIEPYVAVGFNSYSTEHPLQVYAANGFVVLNMSFPFPNAVGLERLGPAAAKQLYSQTLDFPHMAMLMESTVRGLDTAISRGFVDEHKVGIGGVSHGSFIPLYMMQKYDRISAISISSPGWGALSYYLFTRKGREVVAASYGKAGYEDFMPNPDTPIGSEFWRRLDVADHVASIEAPVLLHIADQELVGFLRLIRTLEEQGKPYDAYVFPDEDHIKWQPAHMQAIMQRNLDWFRFWLQADEDPQVQKERQYNRWRQLRSSNAPSATKSSRSAASKGSSAQRP